MSVYASGASIGSVYGHPLVVTLTTTNQKVITQVITARDGKPGYVFRGRKILLAANAESTKIAGFVDAHADQFLDSADSMGNFEPAGLVFADYEFSYAEAGGTRVWQKKSDRAAQTIQDAIAESSLATVNRSTSLGTQITDFVSKNLWVILGVGALITLVWMNSGKKGKKSKGFSFGF